MNEQPKLEKVVVKGGVRTIDVDAEPMRPTAAPLSIHEQFILRHAPRAPEKDDIINGLADAVLHARMTGVEIASRHDTILADEMRTLAKRHQVARNVAFDLFGGAAKKLDRVLEQARAEIKAIDAMTPASPPKMTVEFVAEEEIRRALRDMTEEKRSRAIANAIEKDDRKLLAAILNAHHVASGLADAEYTFLRHRWMVKQHPAELKRRERIAAAIEETQRIGGIMIGWVGSLTDLDIIKAAQGKEQRALEAERIA